MLLVSAAKVSGVIITLREGSFFSDRTCSKSNVKCIITTDLFVLNFRNNESSLIKIFYYLGLILLGMKWNQWNPIFLITKLWNK